MLVAPHDPSAMSEEDWARRLWKRTASAANIKSTLQYQICERAGLLVECPWRPDDRTVSKRKGEKMIQLWRQALQQIADVLEEES